MNWTRTKTTLAAIAATLWWIVASYGQSAQPVILLQAGSPVGSGNPLYIQGTLTASLGGFTPSASGARMTQLSVTTSDSSGTLPTGAVVVVSDTGANPMFCNVNAVAATTSDQLIPASSWFAFTIPSGVTTLHCIATGNTTTADGVGGSGLATGAGGGGSSGGGAVYGPTAGGSAAANPPVLMGGTVDGTTTGNVDNWKVASGIGYITGNLTQGGSALSTTNGLYSNLLQGNAVLSATNGLFNNILQGNAVLSATNGLFSNLLQGNAVLSTSNPIFVTGTGTAGSAATNPITVQGIASMTPLLANPGTAANWGVGATGSAVPANSTYAGANIGGNLVGMHLCGSKAYVHITSATDTQIVAASGSTTVYICDWEASAGGAVNFYFEKSSTGTCGSPTQIGQTWYANAAGWGKIAANNFYRGSNTGASQQLCVNTASFTGPLDVTVYYDQY